ncbi:leucine-rich repeat domain-containing protein [Planctomicrobium sp. SH664]|uniref:leucine-rich repeat domain-containing protein n=1 Tax=Planctomicrobium sp. SH664 TaxID=3448125 RepID=UPI003F5B3826
MTEPAFHEVRLMPASKSPVVLAALALLTCCGCPPKLADGPAKPTTEQAPATQPAGEVAQAPAAALKDDPQAVEALAAAGAVFRKDAAGNVIAIDCQKMAITDAQLPLLKGLPSLQVLSLENGVITDAGLEILKDLPPLVELSLRRCSQIGAAGLAHLKAQPNLQRLLLLYTRTTDDGLAHLAGVKKLKVLDLRGCTEVGDAGLKHLEVLSDLVDLKLRSDGVTNAGMESVGKLQNLRQLSLEDCRVGDPGMAALAGLSKLRVLNAMRTYISDKGLAHLAGSSLEDLRLRESAVRGPGLDALQKSIPTLARLDLSEVLIDNDGLSHLLPFKKLEVLILWNGSMTDEGVAQLAELPEITELDLHGCPELTSATADTFVKLTKLKNLNVAETGFDDDGLEKLAGLKSLKVLSVSQTQVSDKGLQKFRAARPDCEVVE